MKTTFVVLFGILFALFGVLLSLIMLYSSPDNKVHPLESSLFLIGSTIVIAGVFCYLKKSDDKTGGVK